ncbi:MAG: carboxymuconolactone decarboxylase family protein [Candidatus Zixiibacteriota bacterium]|nr:MAG: carboxymuconolactone decarboxylase family protein [candidate division Zixibacteria bacterium]
MPRKTLSEIDPSFDLMGQFARVTKGTPALIQKMRQQAILADDRVPAKYKALAATLWSVAARCEPCIAFYVQEAAKRGATEEELGEFLAVASTMGGCVGEMWALKAFRAFHQINDDSDDTADSQSASCCC